MGGGCGAPIRRGAWCRRDQCPGTAGAGVPKAACVLAHDARGSRGSHGRTARSRPPGLLLPGAAGHMRGPSGRERGRRSLEGSQHQAQRPPGFFGPRNGATPSLRARRGRGSRRVRPEPLPFRPDRGPEPLSSSKGVRSSVTRAEERTWRAEGGARGGAGAAAGTCAGKGSGAPL